MTKQEIIDTLRFEAARYKSIAILMAYIRKPAEEYQKRAEAFSAAADILEDRKCTAKEKENRPLTEQYS